MAEESSPNMVPSERLIQEGTDCTVQTGRTDLSELKQDEGIPLEAPPESVPETGTSPGTLQRLLEDDKDREIERLKARLSTLETQLSSWTSGQARILEQAVQDHLILEEWSRQYRARIENALPLLPNLHLVPPSASVPSTKGQIDQNWIPFNEQMAAAERSSARPSPPGPVASSSLSQSQRVIPKKVTVSAAERHRLEQMYTMKGQMRDGRGRPQLRQMASEPAQQPEKMPVQPTLLSQSKAESEGVPEPKLSTISPMIRSSSESRSSAGSRITPPFDSSENRRGSASGQRLSQRFHSQFTSQDPYTDLRSPRAILNFLTNRIAQGMESGKQFILGKVVRDVTVSGSTQGPMRRSVRQQAPETIFQKVLEHPAFDIVFAVLIVLNSIMLGVMAQWQIDNPDYPDPKVFHYIEYAFTFVYLMELILRCICYGCGFFFGKGWGWNLFDLAIVLMGLIQFVFEMVETNNAISSSSEQIITKVVHMMRLLRVVRIIRVLRFLAELRMMVTLIMHSLRSLFWLMVLLFVTMYVYAIIVTQAVGDYALGDSVDPTLLPVLLDKFGGIGSSLYTLYAAITGGLIWMDVVQILDRACGRVFSFLFVSYIFIGIFCILNVVTGVYVDGAIQRSAQERDLRLEKEREDRESYESMLLDLLAEIDLEGTGQISREMLEDAFEKDRVRHFFSVLEIEVHDSNYLFDMLDLDQSGVVEIEEFVTGCLKFKGSAKSIDVHTLMFEISRMMTKWDGLFKTISGHSGRAAYVNEQNAADQSGLPMDFLNSSLLAPDTSL